MTASHFRTCHFVGERQGAEGEHMEAARHIEANQDQWVGSRKLMVTLEISRSTVARMVKRGCPHIWVGSQRRFNLNQVIQWLKQQG